MSVAFKAFTENLVLGSEKKGFQEVRSVGEEEGLVKLKDFNLN
jgi:hypothetical protein